jgi:hypothetical protein
MKPVISRVCTEVCFGQARSDSILVNREMGWKSQPK